jgi:hypothetical protein
LKKRRPARDNQKTFGNWTVLVETTVAQINKSFFASFFAKKEVLACLA